MVGTILSRLVSAQPVTIFGDGHAVRDFIYVEDVAAAFVHALQYNGDERIFNIGSGEGTDLMTLLAMVEEISGQTISRQSAPARPFDVRENVLDIHRARACLGWQPAITLHTGLERTWEFFRAHMELPH